SSMAGLHLHTVLVTGANRGIGLGLIQKLLELPNPPQWVFAGCRDPNGQRARVRPGWEAGAVLGMGARGPGQQRRCRCCPLGRSWSSPLCHLHVPMLPTGKELVLSPVPSPRAPCSSQAFLPLLKKAAQGSPGSALSCSKAAIINISSNGGSIASPAGWELMHFLSYRCSKAALNMLTKCQSLAYREHGVLCVALHPGWVQTDMGGSGPEKPPLTVDDSVRGMLKVLSSLSEKDTGTFLDWEGKVVLW
ncbi:C-factor, partial [Calypte anna]